jgi:xanthosine utilization system XapX-like protein
MAGAVLVWIAKTYLKTDIPAEVAIAMIGLIATGVGYVTPIKRREIRF